jgi:hypothetical protein
MSGKAKLIASLGVALAPWLLALPGAGFAADEQFTVSKIIDIPPNTLNPTGGTNSFDIGFDDSSISTYVLADRTNFGVDVINTVNNSYVRQLTGCGGNVTFPNCTQFVGVHATPANSSGPNGVIIVDQKTVWAGDGVLVDSMGNTTKTSHVYVIDLATNKLLGSIDTGGNRRADELCHDPRTGVVLVANDDPSDSFITFISTTAPYPIVGKIKLDGTDPAGNNIKANGIEQCQWNPRNHKFYLSVPDIGGGSGAVLVISTNGPYKVEQVRNVDATTTGCAGPQGLAIGPGHEVQLGCGGANSVIIDDASGKVIAVESGEGGADEVWYNPSDNHFFLARSGGAALGVEDAGPPANPDGDAPTAGGSHSVAADSVSNQVYVPGNKAATALCGQLMHTPDNIGCIAVFTGPPDGDDAVGNGSGKNNGN